MKWYQIKDKKPPEGENVLVCFDAKNENSCLVVAMDLEGHDGKPEWYSPDVEYPVSRRDWWAKIELPKE